MVADPRRAIGSARVFRVCAEFGAKGERSTNAGPSASLRSAQDDYVVGSVRFAIPYTQVSQVNINERGLYEA